MIKDQPRAKFYLERPMLIRARAGEHNFINLVRDVLRENGFEVSFEKNFELIRQTSVHGNNFALFHQSIPFHIKALCFRKAYFAPFWRIETTEQRWETSVARAEFDPEAIDPVKASQFYHYWQQRLFQEAPKHIEDCGFIYVPLQGRLTSHRSFQICSPIEMLTHVTTYALNTPIKITLHPKETYSEDEMHALTKIVDRFENVSIVTTAANALLQRCSYLVTQNSSLAFHALFYQKPTILFGLIDFHHISLSVSKLGVSECFKLIAAHKPDFAKYIFWFWQLKAINSGHLSAKAKITQALLRGGWPIEPTSITHNEAHLA